MPLSVSADGGFFWSFDMSITLKEMKNYLRVDGTEDDTLPGCFTDRSTARQP